MPNATATCAVCHASFTQRRRDQRYCSEHCKNRRERVNDDNRGRRHRGWAECITCGVRFSKASVGQVRCSRICAATDQRGSSPASVILWRVCSRCARPFTTRGRRRCGCSRSASLPMGSAVSSTCAECGGSFFYESGTRPRVICSTRCRRRRAQRNKPRQDWGKNDRSRARHFGVSYEPIRRPLVYERDGWTCQLCGKTINRKVKAPHPKSASLDHIIPMSLGGPHLYSNVQCAHFECNWKKGTGVLPLGEQLRLVG